MTTVLRLALDACGLSQREAAEFLNVRRDTVDKALNGRTATPPGWLLELRGLHGRQRQAANQALEAIYRQTADRGPGEIEVGYCTDDAEAQSLGWPTANAHAVTLRMIWEDLPDGCRLILSPRGSTIGTAAAADAHRR